MLKNETPFKLALHKVEQCYEYQGVYSLVFLWDIMYVFINIIHRLP